MTEPKYKVVLSKQAKREILDLMMDSSTEDLRALQDVLDKIRACAEDGSIDQLGEPVDMEKLAIEDPELHDSILRSLSEVEGEPSN